MQGSVLSIAKDVSLNLVISKRCAVLSSYYDPPRCI
jgi:hypothetical protein